MLMTVDAAATGFRARGNATAIRIANRDQIVNVEKARKSSTAAPASADRHAIIPRRAMLQHPENLERIGTAAVIDAGVGEQDSPVRADHIGRRERKRPVVGRAVFARNVELECRRTQCAIRR